MSETVFTRALTTEAVTGDHAGSVAYQDVDLERVSEHMYVLMRRNIATDGFPFIDSSRTVLSVPGCVIAAPSCPALTPGISQDYIFNWTRDAAITALEMVAAEPAEPGKPVQALCDYVNFAKICQDNATPTLGHACYTIDGHARPWSEQNDGPAVQTLAILAAWNLLDAATQDVAREIVTKNIDYLLGCYQQPTTNLWEEHQGFSFFARSVQLACFEAVSAENPMGFAAPAGVADAINWLRAALDAHWNQADSQYMTMIGGTAPGDPQQPVVPDGYDPNIDIIQAAIYGAVAFTDTKLLATAADLRRIWADPNSPEVFPINVADQENGVGPMFGRYPGDLYDGGAGGLGDHPWPLCTASFAQLYYEVANDVRNRGEVPIDDLSRDFFAQVGISADTTAGDAADALQDAGDAVLRAVIAHSDHLELSEQFDGVSGYEKSVRNLTWSYAAFLSAVRARNRVPVQG